MEKNLDYRGKAFKYLPAHCAICYGAKFLTVHHKDKNVKNNDLENLQIICRDCHNEIHGVNTKKSVVRRKWQPGTRRNKR